MKLITLMDYEDPAKVLMCKGWLFLARRFNPHTAITVLHGRKDITGIERFAKDRIGNVSFAKLDLDAILPKEKMNGHVFPSQDLTFARWVTLERLGYDKYIFVEADAMVLADLEPWRRVMYEKPFIAVKEDDREGPPYFNIGVFSHNAPRPFFTYEKLMREYRLQGDSIPISTGDQALANLVAWRDGYDAFHPKIDVTWNCPTYGRWYPTGLVRVGRADDLAVEAFYDGRPVNILHTWGPLKWWDTRELRPITEYLEGKIR